MGSLLVITGPPGAGKSAVAREISMLLEPSVLVPGDAFFGFLGHGLIDPWLAEAHDQNRVVVRVAAQAAGRFAREGYEVVYDGVVGPWFLADYQRASQVDRLDYAVLLPPKDICLGRVMNRVDHGFKDEAASARMYDDFAGAGIDSRHVFDDAATQAFELAAAILARRASGELVCSSV